MALCHYVFLDKVPFSMLCAFELRVKLLKYIVKLIKYLTLHYKPIVQIFYTTLLAVVY